MDNTIGIMEDNSVVGDLNYGGWHQEFQSRRILVCYRETGKIFWQRIWLFFVLEKNHLRQKQRVFG